MNVVFGLFLVASVGGLILTQRLMAGGQQREHNDVAGFIYSVLGVAYAVLLGLMVVAVWQDRQSAEDAATEEATELAAVFWLAHALPEKQAGQIQDLVHSYAIVVAEEEWPLMATVGKVRGPGILWMRSGFASKSSIPSRTPR